MNVYKLESYVQINLDDPESEDYDEDNIHKVTYDCSIGAYTLEEAVANGMDFMNEHFEEWEFKSASLVAEDVINWPDNEEDEHWTGDCPCPYEAFKDTVLDNRLKFKCSCGEDIRVADNGWKSIKCLHCNIWISREEVIREKGVLLYKKIDKPELGDQLNV